MSNSSSESDFFAHETACVDDGAIVGNNSKIWHFAHVMKGAVIGEGCILGQNVVVMPNVSVGNFCKVQNNVSLYEGVVLEDYVFCGPSMVFTNVLTPRAEFPRATSEHYHKTLVKRGASIGANATIVCGNPIGEYAFIGAGSVVTKEVPDYALIVGNPAKQIGWMSSFGHRLAFDEKNEATCPESNERYKLENNKVIRIA